MKYMYAVNQIRFLMSRPVRALWIEMSQMIGLLITLWVEAREGLVD